ncbi:MAG: DUF3127 domain-containing protein [Bacteroidetes bacterium]|nr:DUF3127 domain-containing protein [Bacteroidota bacterium]
MSFEITGKLTEKFETQEITSSFKKREFVIEKTESSGGREFIEVIKFQLSQDKCDLIDPYQPNEEIKIHFNIKGRKWEKEGRVSYFTNLEAWRIERIANNQNTDEAPQPGLDKIPPEMDDDLPF